MTERLVREETPAVFFREQLVLAMEHQNVSTSAFTECYLVNLLASAVRGGALPPPTPGFDEMPLALLYVRAVQASRHERAKLLRTMGDTALFVAGFFADSLNRGLVDLDYYRSMGGRAYARLGDEEDRTFSPGVFRELAARFIQFADLLQEVSETSRLTSQASVVKLYERWARTGSRRAALLLAEQGIAPMPTGEERVQ
jgi:hypothetical protein